VLCPDTQTPISWWTYYRSWSRFQKRVLGYVKKIATKGITILVSTPYMDAALCDRIALIQKAILKIDTPTNIISNYDKTIYNVRTRIPTN
jgi:ABC-type multidrug transport system ATPase subunit